MKLLNAIEVVQALEFGERVQMLIGDEWKNLNPTLITLAQLIRSDTKYRRAPENITVGGVSFPKAESEPLQDGDKYWVADPTFTSYALSDMWRGDKLDELALSRGLLHKRKEDAIAHAKALIKLSGGLCDE